MRYDLPSVTHGKMREYGDGRNRFEPQGGQRGLGGEGI